MIKKILRLWGFTFISPC